MTLRDTASGLNVDWSQGWEKQGDTELPEVLMELIVTQGTLLSELYAVWQWQLVSSVCFVEWLPVSRLTFLTYQMGRLNKVS